MSHKNTNNTSVTAKVVCAARAIGVSSQLRDALAPAFASGWRARALRGFATDTAPVAAVRFALRAASLGLVDHNTVRMLMIDDYLRRWVAGGIRQVVILGAGLDSRAWRLEGLEGCHVFEVDQVATQALKLQRVATWPKSTASTRFVAADLRDAEALSGGLLSSGFVSQEPSAWICEGVTAYLPPAAIAQLLNAIASLSATGSQLAMSYIPETTNPKVARRQKLFLRLVRGVGERAPGVVGSAWLADQACKAGLLPAEDLGWREWKARLPNYSPMPNLLQERLLVAQPHTPRPSHRGA